VQMSLYFSLENDLFSFLLPTTKLPQSGAEKERRVKKHRLPFFLLCSILVDVANSNLLYFYLRWEETVTDS